MFSLALRHPMYQCQHAPDAIHGGGYGSTGAGPSAERLEPRVGLDKIAISRYRLTCCNSLELAGLRVKTRISRSQPEFGEADKTRASNKRELILNAGLRLFSHQSYQNVTMEQVASLAGVAKGTLYLYYPSKDALYLGILRNGLDATFGDYDSMLRSTEDVRERLRKILFVALRYYDEQRDLLRLLVTHEPHLAEQRRALIKASRERMIEIIISLIRQGLSEGLFRPVNPRLAAIAIQGAVSGISLYYKVPESGTSITEQLDELIGHGIAIAAIPNVRSAPPGRRKSSPVRLPSAELAEGGS